MYQYIVSIVFTILEWSKQFVCSENDVKIETDKLMNEWLVNKYSKNTLLFSISKSMKKEKYESLYNKVYNSKLYIY